MIKKVLFIILLVLLLIVVGVGVSLGTYMYNQYMNRELTTVEKVMAEQTDESNLSELEFNDLYINISKQDKIIAYVVLDITVLISPNKEEQFKKWDYRFKDKLLEKLNQMANMGYFSKNDNNRNREIKKEIKEALMSIGGDDIKSVYINKYVRQDT